MAEPAPLTLISGEEPFLVDQSVRAWRDRVAQGGVQVEVFDSPSKIDGFRMSIAEMPLFDPERVVILRDPPQLGGRARSGDDATALAAALEMRAPTTALCIVHHGALAAGNPVAAAVSRLGGTLQGHPRLAGRDLRSWLERSVRDRRLSLDSASLDHLQAVCGADLGALSGELDKLANFADGAPLRLSDVRRLAAGDSHVEVWSVLEWLLGPTPGRGAAAIDDLVGGGGSAQYLLITLSGQIRDLLLAQALLSERGAGAAQVTAELGVPPWRADRLLRQARLIPGRVAAAWLRDLHRIDVEIKSGLIDDVAALSSFGRRAAAAVVASRR